MTEQTQRIERKEMYGVVITPLPKDFNALEGCATHVEYDAILSKFKSPASLSMMISRNSLYTLGDQTYKVNEVLTPGSERAGRKILDDLVAIMVKNPGISIEASVEVK